MKSLDRCVIVSGGDFSPVSGLLQEDFVIACDRGYQWCERMGLKPDLLISDFDSYDGPVAQGIRLDRHIPEKDDTDTMLAVRYAVEHGFRSILVCCALGGRLDHLIANLQAMLFAQTHGVSAVLQCEDTEIFTLRNSSLKLPRRDGWSLSVFALDGPCRGVCIRGAKYPLENAELIPSLPLGVSNQWIAEEAVISVLEGTLMIVLSELTDGK